MHILFVALCNMLCYLQIVLLLIMPLGVVVIFAAYGAINTLSGDLNGCIRLYVIVYIWVIV